jgi:MFS family permease
MIFSPLALGYLTGLYGELSSIYVVILVEFISLAILGFLISYRKKPMAANRETGLTAGDVSVTSKTSPRFVAAYLSIMLWGVISTVVLALFPNYVENILGYATEDFGNLLMIWNAVRTVGFIVIARLPEARMSLVIIIGAILSLLSSVILFVFVDILLFAIAMALSGLGVGFSYLGAVYLVVSATESEKGAHAGLIESMGGFGLFIGPIVGGWFMDFGATLPYLMCIILSFIVTLLVIPLLKKSEL